ncbi:MAG: family 20 glycosylhydrolase [Bacteroidota bacterium]
MCFFANRLPTIGLILLLTSLLSCQSEPATNLSQEALIPYPRQVIADSSNFVLSTKTVIHVLDEPKLRTLAEYLQEAILEKTGLELPIEIGNDQVGRGNIYLRYWGADVPKRGAEEYDLDIFKREILLTAFESEGLFRAIQTLMQLIPGEPSDTEKDIRKIPTGTIKDQPQYAYRGMMLDVARHFFEVEDVKRVIDLLALCKINYLHLHLADDQGWRIEIKRYPLLTEIGGSTEVDGGPGGYYTEEDYQEIIHYAQERYITIVPEIDMPGHTNAALASYPELNCSGVSPDLYTGTNVGFSTLCTDKPEVLAFVSNVITDLAHMTPGPYIHVGGDESHVTALEDYIPFISKVNGFVEKADKKMMGWDEISHANLLDGAVVQYWRHADNAIRGVDQGAKVLLSPAHKVYLDMQYDSTTELGLHWAAYIEADSAHQWDPEAIVEGLDPEAILGIESPLWSETVTNIDEIEYMIFPRLLAHAELGWSAPKHRNWADFKRRFQAYQAQLDALDVNYYRSPKLE